MNDPFGSGSAQGSVTSKLCSISGTSRRASSAKLEPMTGISIFFDSKHHRPMEHGMGFVSPDTIAAQAWELAAPGDPHPSIERKIQTADENSCNRQHCRRDVRIHQLIQVMEQETSLVRLDASPDLKPVFQQS